MMPLVQWAGEIMCGTSVWWLVEEEGAKRKKPTNSNEAAPTSPSAKLRC